MSQLLVHWGGNAVGVIVGVRVGVDVLVAVEYGSGVCVSVGVDVIMVGVMVRVGVGGAGVGGMPPAFALVGWSVHSRKTCLTMVRRAVELSVMLGMTPVIDE